MTGSHMFLGRTSILAIDPEPSILLCVKVLSRIGYNSLDVNTVKQRDAWLEFRMRPQPTHQSANGMCITLGKSLSSVPWVFYLSNKVNKSYYVLWNSSTPMQERGDVSVELRHSFSTLVTLCSLLIHPEATSTKCQREWRVWSKSQSRQFWLMLRNWGKWWLVKGARIAHSFSRKFSFFASMVVQSY